jgi:hypothetical protein
MGWNWLAWLELGGVNCVRGGRVDSMIDCSSFLDYTRLFLGGEGVSFMGKSFEVIS